MSDDSSDSEYELLGFKETGTSFVIRKKSFGKKEKEAQVAEQNKTQDAAKRIEQAETDQAGFHSQTSKRRRKQKKFKSSESDQERPGGSMRNLVLYGKIIDLTPGSKRYKLEVTDSEEDTSNTSQEEVLVVEKPVVETSNDEIDDSDEEDSYEGDSDEEDSYEGDSDEEDSCEGDPDEDLLLGYDQRLRPHLQANFSKR